MSPEGVGYAGPATLIQGDRRAEVQCGFQVMESLDGDSRQWRGWYKGAAPEGELDAGEAQLILEDGAAGAINITRALKGQGEGTFMGVGEPPTSN